MTTGIIVLILVSVIAHSIGCAMASSHRENGLFLMSMGFGGLCSAVILLVRLIGLI